jgi:hypothetical protein
MVASASEGLWWSLSSPITSMTFTFLGTPRGCDHNSIFLWRFHSIDVLRLFSSLSNACKCFEEDCGHFPNSPPPSITSPFWCFSERETIWRNFKSSYHCNMRHFEYFIIIIELVELGRTTSVNYPLLSELGDLKTLNFPASRGLWHENDYLCNIWDPDSPSKLNY